MLMFFELKVSHSSGVGASTLPSTRSPPIGSYRELRGFQIPQVPFQAPVFPHLPASVRLDFEQATPVTTDEQCHLWPLGAASPAPKTQQTSQLLPPHGEVLTGRCQRRMQGSGTSSSLWQWDIRVLVCNLVAASLFPRATLPGPPL